MTKPAKPTKPKDIRKTGRPKATMPTGQLDVRRIAELRASATPELSWHKVGIALGVTGEAARRFYERWKHLLDAPPE